MSVQEKIQKTIQNIDWQSELKEKKFVNVDTLGAAACMGVSETGESACFL